METCRKYVSKFLGLIQEPLHQYYTSLYSFEYIFHAESKFGQKENCFENILKSLKCYVSSTADIRVKGVRQRRGEALNFFFSDRGIRPGFPKCGPSN